MHAMPRFADPNDLADGRGHLGFVVAPTPARSGLDSRKPWWEFNRTYFAKRGFQVGPKGLAIAWMGALYVFLKYAKARYMLPGRR